MQLSRTFASNIAKPSALRSISASPLALAVEAGAAWDAHDCLLLRGAVRAAFLGKAKVPADPAYGLPSAVEVETGGLEAGVDAVGRLRFGSGWAGVYVGGRYLRQTFQETRPFPLFLTTSVIGAAAGGAFAWRFGDLDLRARGGLVFPLSVSQAPADSGDVASKSGYEAGGEVGYAFGPSFGAYVAADYTHLALDFRGRSAHADTATGPAPKTYDQASERDAFLAATLGVRWTP
jgi:hypothetical protein